MKKIEINSHNIKIWLLMLLAVSLPLSRFGISLAMILLVINWLVEGRFRRKYEKLMANRALLVFLAFIPVHLIWLLSSSDLAYGIHDIKIKLPFLVLPLVLGSGSTIRGWELNNILYTFIVAVFIGSLISMGAFLGVGGFEYTNIREISLFISHIRFSNMIVLAIFLLAYLAINPDEKKGIARIVMECLLLVWLVIFLFVLKSATGIVIFLVILFMAALVIMVSARSYMLRYSVAALLITGFMAIVYITSIYINRFNWEEQVTLSQLPTHSEAGNLYTHDTLNPQLENGHRVWLYVCEYEMSGEWGKRSEVDYYGKDNKEQDLRFTLIRYLSSKAFRKDSSGVARLSDEDVINVENGMSNYIYARKLSFYPLAYELMWQFREYRRGANPSGHSVTQRIEYLRTGWNIVRAHPVFGVGTGDVPLAFAEQYKKDGSVLNALWRLRTHNQYLTFLISFGAVGFVLIMFILLYPVFALKAWQSFYALVFLGILLFSMLNEDVFETSIGAVFNAFFYTLFVLSGKGRLHKP